MKCQVLFLYTSFEKKQTYYVMTLSNYLRRGMGWGWGRGVMYLASPGSSTEIGLQLGRRFILVAGMSRGGMFLFLLFLHLHSCSSAGFIGSVGCASDWWSEGCRFDPRRVGNILSWRFDHEIFSTVILSFWLIQEGQLSVFCKRMRTILVNGLED